MARFSFKPYLIASLAIMCAGAIPAYSANWMGSIDDNAYVRAISIPGTHDSATGNGFQGFLGGLAGKSTGLTQDLALDAQWDAGVRAFDLRPTVLGKGDNAYLQIHHGVLETKLSLADALLALAAKLEANPSEFAIVLMRHESDADSDAGSSWGDLVNACLSRSDIKPYLADFKRNLTVGDIRGKMLIISRDIYTSGPFGAYASGWSHSKEYADQTKATFKGAHNTEGAIIQDYYECVDDIDGKLAAVNRVLGESMKADNKKWIVNHASGYTAKSSTKGIQDCAAHTNKAIADFLADNSGNTGIVMMDFAGVDKSGGYDVMGQALVNAIIENNKRYTPDAMAGIADAKAEDLITVAGRGIYAHGRIEAYSITGAKVAEGNESITLPSAGIYIVRACGRTTKVAVTD